MAAATASARSSSRRSTGWLVVVAALGLAGWLAIDWTSSRIDRYPQAVQDNFLRSCAVAGSTPSRCACVLDRIERDVPYSEFVGLDALATSTGRVPSELTGAVSECRFNTDVKGWLDQRWVLVGAAGALSVLGLRLVIPRSPGSAPPSPGTGPAGSYAPSSRPIGPLVTVLADQLSPGCQLVTDEGPRLVTRVMRAPERPGVVEVELAQGGHASLLAGSEVDIVNERR